jgi:hypothetical protein
MIPCRSDRSILKVIGLLFGSVGHGVAALLPSRLSVERRCNPEAKRKTLKGND